ncbi:hypothetical protein, partial [Bradyrhizobium sp. 147]|uniref:hypothetical protein n=1 Tax=Bradyrhizobium sp. 147 TaxID=2782623 RepID=UPI001FF83E31
GLVAALAGLECAIRHEQSVHRPTKMPEFLPSLVGSTIISDFPNTLTRLGFSTVHGVVFAYFVLSGPGLPLRS